MIETRTLLFGSHILRCNRILNMAPLCMMQMMYPSAVNEDEFKTAISYLILTGRAIISSPDEVEHFEGQLKVEQYLEMVSVSSVLLGDALCLRS